MQYFPDIRINNKELALVDFKGDAMTFKATSEAVLCGLTQCMDLLNQREELWRKRLVREQARINKLEETCDALRKNVSISSGPDLEVTQLLLTTNLTIYAFID